MKIVVPCGTGWGPAPLVHTTGTPNTRRTDVIDSSETAYYLRQRLGPLRAWSDFLTDVRRGRTDLGGHQLHPCCRIRHRGWVPAYAIEDIREFVASVLNDVSEAGSATFDTVSVTIDPAAHWRASINSFNKDGTVYAAQQGAE
jgi:hypothetical protein